MQPKNKHFKNLLKQLSQRHEVGLHPSYRSNQSIKILEKEVKTLENIVGQDIRKSRQHYLKVSLPETYRNLAMTGIKEDFSMGFADQVGFRAGTCRPFQFYDLFEEKPLDLTIYPLVAMDATMRLYLKWTPDEALQKLSGLYQTIKEYNGQFMILWHNSSLTEYGGWKEWQHVYKQVIDNYSH